VERKVTRGVDQPEVEGYQWDGWKLIMIAKLNTNGTFHSRKWSCVWRPDVGSSLYARSDWMRAGGVGGVAWLQTGAVQSYSYGTGSGEVHVPLADHMGNVRHYYQFRASGKTVTGQLVASYEYDAFGREVRAWGLNTPTENQPPGLPASRPWADHLPFHYSSKLRDVDSGFNYYGYRFYDPGAGRWLNRDPIEERGGVNLYGMCYNNSLRFYDYLGREPQGQAPAPAPPAPNADPATTPGGGALRRGQKAPSNCLGHACRTGKNEKDPNALSMTPHDDPTCKTPCKDGKIRVRLYYPQDGGPNSDPKKHPPDHAIGEDPNNSGDWTHQLGEGGPIYDDVENPDLDFAAYYCRRNPAKCKGPDGKVKLPKITVKCMCVCPPLAPAKK
jgi:RHS repeat-associated protein